MAAPTPKDMLLAAAAAAAAAEAAAAAPAPAPAPSGKKAAAAGAAAGATAGASAAVAPAGTASPGGNPALAELLKSMNAKLDNITSELKRKREAEDEVIAYSPKVMTAAERAHFLTTFMKDNLHQPSSSKKKRVLPRFKAAWVDLSREERYTIRMNVARCFKRSCFDCCAFWTEIGGNMDNQGTVQRRSWVGCEALLSQTRAAYFNVRKKEMPYVMDASFEGELNHFPLATS